jgi:hypothetical protein
MDLSKILLILFALVNVATLVSRSVMAKVGNNNGSGCPDVSGPAIACSFYGVSFLIILGLTFSNRTELLSNKLTFTLLVIIILMNMAIFIAYIPFTIKAKNKSSTDTECLTTENKDAIEYMELIINGSLVILSIIVGIMNSSS